MSGPNAPAIKNLYRIVPMHALRRTPGVSFDYLKLGDLGSVHSFDRVVHVAGAISPGPVGDVERPWYMHTHQQDNLVVLHGVRYVDLYSQEHGCLEHFTVTPERILHGEAVLWEGAAILSWPCGVFHRVISCEKEGSASLNLATHSPGFDVQTNFDVYALDTETGANRVIRKGFLDQKKHPLLNPNS